MLVQIADDNIELATSLNDYLSKQKNIKTFVTSTVEDTINMYKKILPDILILDLNFPEKSGLDVISALCDDEKEEAKCNILIFSGYVNDIIVRYISKIYRICDKPCDFEYILECIKKMYNNNKEDFVENKYKNIIKNLGFNFTHLGTSFLIDVLTLIETKEIDDITLINICAEVGKIKNIPPRKVIWNIGKAIDSIEQYNTHKKIKNILPNYDGRKLTPKYLISLIIEESHNLI